MPAQFLERIVASKDATMRFFLEKDISACPVESLWT